MIDVVATAALFGLAVHSAFDAHRSRGMRIAGCLIFSFLAWLYLGTHR